MCFHGAVCVALIEVGKQVPLAKGSLPQTQRWRLAPICLQMVSAIQLWLQSQLCRMDGQID